MGTSPASGVTAEKLMTTELMFVRLHEFNDWEGEEWNWWIQLTDNEWAVSKLAEMLRDEERRLGTELWYQLHLEDIEPESVVDKLVEYAIGGYHDSDNKVKGMLKVPDYLGEEAEHLYKGGIAQYYTEYA